MHALVNICFLLNGCIHTESIWFSRSQIIWCLETNHIQQTNHIHIQDVPG